MELELMEFLEQCWLWQLCQPLQVVADKGLEACLCIAPGHVPLHVQHVWDTDMPRQQLLLLELVCRLCETQHSLVDVIGPYCIQLGSYLPKSPSNKLFQAGIFQLHQFLALSTFAGPYNVLLTKAIACLKRISARLWILELSRLAFGCAAPLLARLLTAILPAPAQSI